MMSLSVRRVVTGHDKSGRAIVSIDETVRNVAQLRPGAEAAAIWTSEGFPSTTTATTTPPRAKSAPHFPTARYSAW
jgi:hypothetical protein